MSDSVSSPATIRRIVIVRPNHRLGNALLLIPVIEELGRRFPDADLELVTTGGAAAAVFRAFPRVTAVHAFPGRSFLEPMAVLRLLWILNSRRFDLAVDPMLRSRAGRFVLMRMRAGRRLGFLWNDVGRDRSLTDCVSSRDVPAHFAQAPVHLVRRAFGGEEAPCVTPSLRLDREEIEAGRRRLALVVATSTRGTVQRPVRTVALFAHATGQKIYPTAWWRRIVSQLHAVLPEVRLIEIVPADGRRRLGGDIAELHTPDLRLLAATLAATSLFVSADCGVMHLADAAGARVLGLFKSTDPARYGPRGAQSDWVQASDEDADHVASMIVRKLASCGAD